MGLAGVAGVAASGAVVVRRRRTHADYDPDALREKLHERLAGTREADRAADDPSRADRVADDGSPPAA